MNRVTHKEMAKVVDGRNVLLLDYDRFPFFILDSVFNKRNVPMHTHDFFEIDMVLGGNGANITRSGRHTLQEHDIVLGNQMEEHAIESLPVLTTRSIKFDRTIFGDDAFSARFFLPFVSRLPDFGAKLALDDAARASLFAIASALSAEYETQNVHWERTIVSLLSAFLTIIYRAYEKYASRRGISVTETAQPLVTAIIAYFEEHYSGEMRIADVFKRFSVSASRANTLFKRATGRSMRGYLTALRLLKARKMLAATEMPIADICFSAGFSDISNFNRAFREFSGKSPGEFRKDPR